MTTSPPGGGRDGPSGDRAAPPPISCYDAAPHQDSHRPPAYDLELLAAVQRATGKLVRSGKLANGGTLPALDDQFGRAPLVSQLAVIVLKGETLIWLEQLDRLSMPDGR